MCSNIDIDNMDIIQNNDKFLVKENDQILYTANNLSEAEWYIKWKIRKGAIESEEECG